MKPVFGAALRPSGIRCLDRMSTARLVSQSGTVTWRRAAATGSKPPSNPGREPRPSKAASECRPAQSKHVFSPTPPSPAKGAAPKPRPFQGKPSLPASKEKAQSQGPTYAPPSPPPAPLSKDDLARNPARWVGVFGLGAVAACMGLFTAMLVVSNMSEAPRYRTGDEPEVPTGRPAVHSPTDFDDHLDKTEWRFGITKLRRRLVSSLVSGHVLEVAIGTGRNMEFYDWTSLVEPSAGRARGKKVGHVPDKVLESFTGIDISPSMLDVALRRVRQFVPHAVDELPKGPEFIKLSSPGQSGHYGMGLLEGKLRLVQGDAASWLPPPPRDTEKYDTVLQTFGLCSVRDPAALIASMASVVRPDTGRIVLLEHGRGWWDLINNMLDRSALGHFQKFGCWWNRDIEAIMQEAEAAIPGLEIVALERPGWTSLGTHVWVELRVRSDKTTAVEHDSGESWLSRLGSRVLSPQKKPSWAQEKKE